MRWWWCPLCTWPIYLVDFYNAIVLAHWNNSPWVDISLHILRYIIKRSDPSLVSLLIDACLVEKHHITILLSLFWPDWGSIQRSTTLEVSTLTITPLMHHGCDLMVVGFANNYALRLWVGIPLRRDVLDTPLCDKVWLTYDRSMVFSGFFPPVKLTVTI